MQGFNDFFATDGDSLGVNWYAHTGHFHVVSGEAQAQSAGDFDAAFYTAQSLNINQYVYYKIPAIPSIGNYIGALFRYTNASGKCYIVTYNDGTWYWNTWNTIGGSNYTTITSTSGHTMSAGDTVGITISGTGADTIVRIWKNPTNSTPYSLAAWDSSGDTTPDQTWTTDPGANAVDTGSYVGFYTWSNSGYPQTLDDFYGGDDSFSYVNKNSAVGGSVSLSNVTAGNLIVCMLQWEDASGTPTLSDGTNAPDGYGAVSTDGYQYIRFAYWLSSPKSGSVTYSWSSVGSGRTSHVFEVSCSAGNSFRLEHKDAGAYGETNGAAISANETSTKVALVAFGGAGIYDNWAYLSATIDGVAVDQATAIKDDSYQSAGALTMRVLSNPGTYNSAITFDKDTSNDRWAADLICFLETRAVTVKSSGGDYTSRNAALSGESADLVTSTRILTIETYAFEDTTPADTGTGYTVSADYYIKITSPESERHAGVWSSSKSRIKVTGTIGTDAIAVEESYTIVEWQQIEVASDTSSSGSDSSGVTVGYSSNATNIIIRNNIVKRTTAGATQYSTGIGTYSYASQSMSFYIYRNLIYGFNDGTSLSAGIWPDAADDSPTNYVFNNTVYDCDYGIYLSNGVAIVKNNFFGASATSDYADISASSVTSSKNITSDATSPDGASYQGKTSYSDYFLDYANKDFHLKATDTVLRGVGDDLGSPYNIDIDGETVSGTWDIGADEYISSIIAGTTCWGHSTGVTETNTRTFASNWTGTGSIENSGDSENLVLSEGQYMESEIIQTGSETITVTYNYYASGDSITVKYRTAATSAGITGESWSTYSAPFASSGYIQLRLEG